MSSLVHISFGTWLKERRREAGISQDELAERIDCAPITLQKIVSGKRRPSRQIALLLAAYFGVPEDEYEAFVTFARAHTPTPVISTPTSVVDKPAGSSDPALEAQTNASQNAPWRAVHLSKSNLPLVLTTIIGREQELDEVCSRLMQPKVRLLTITGSPGTGKTRMAIEVAAALLDDFGDGVYLVELAPLNDPAMVIPSIARTLDLREAGGQPIEETLLAYVKDKRILLVLDNFEHLLEAGPEIVKLVQASPWVKALITSREALHVRGERQYTLPTLTLPVLQDKPGLEELARNPAVELFTERAQEADAGFALTNENALEVAEVCINLGGLPLAIELAAGRVSLFPPRILLSRLGQQLKVLTGGSRDLPPRQQTLRGAIEWSYDLLDEGHQELFRRMAVFWGGRTLEGLEAVCNSAGLQAEGKGLKVEVRDGVETLLSSNLLQEREGSGGRDEEPRFWMLETIQEYAREKLAEVDEGKGGEAQTLQREHALYFMKMAEEAEPHLTGPKQQEWLSTLEDEYDNIRVALAWCGERAYSSAQESSKESSKEGADIGLRTAGALARFWLVRGLFTEGREQLERALSAPEDVLQECSPGSRAKALSGAGYLAERQGDYSSARSLIEGALVLGREAGDKQSISLYLNILGAVAHEQGDYSEARTLYEEGLVLGRELGNTRRIASLLSNAAGSAYEQGDYAGARAMLEESLTLQREIGDKWAIAHPMTNLGIVAHVQGDYARARALFEESLALRREMGDKKGISDCLNSLASVANEQGDYTLARTLYEEGLALGMELGDKKGITTCLAGLGGVAVGLGQHPQVEIGAKLLGAVEGLLQSLGTVLDRSERLPYERAVASACSLLGEGAFKRGWQEGRGMSLEEAVDFALKWINNSASRS